VHRELGPGFVESVYHRALGHELGRRGIAHRSEVEIEITYDGVAVGRHRLDIIAAPGIVIELKAVQSLDAIHFAQLRSYLKATRMTIGLLLNFAAPRLVIKRVLSQAPASPVPSAPPFLPTLPRFPGRRAQSNPSGAREG